MNTRTIKFIQFHNITESRFDSPKVFTMYPLADENTSCEFMEEMEDDEGDTYEGEVEHDCVQFHWNINEYYNGDDCEYMKLRRLKYNIIEIEVNCDDSGKPIWNVA